MWEYISNKYISLDSLRSPQNFYVEEHFHNYHRLFIIYLSNNWLIDFNDMPTRLGLFYALRLGNRVYCIFLQLLNIKTHSMVGI